MRVRSVFVMAGLVAAMMGTVSVAASAAEGDPDPSFGADGVVTTDFDCRNDRATAVAVQRDGKIVAVGSAEVDSLERDFGLVRYNVDGSLDPSFGSGGMAVTDFGTANDWPVGMAIQADGKIVVAGNNGDEVILARYEQDGMPDATFATGVVTAGLAGSYQAEGLALQQDGKIIVAGSFADEGVGTFNELLIMRFLADGSFDPTFGSGGRVMTAFAGEGGGAHAVAVQPDGRIVTAGWQIDALVGCSPDDPCDVAFALARYQQDGTLDPSFGFGGKVTTGRPGETNWASGVAIQEDGKIVVAGVRDTRPVAWPDFVVVRYRPDGSLDRSFGEGGEVVTDFGGQDSARAVSVQADGKIVAAGVGGTSDPVLDPLHGWIVPAEFAFARYQPDGTLDPSFGFGGKVLVDAGEGNGAHALAPEPAGPIVAAGVGSSGCLGDFAVVRLRGPGPPPGGLVGLVNPANGEWHLRDSSGTETLFFYGDPGDVPFMGDWDGDGVATPGLFRRSDAFAYLRNSNTQGVADIQFFFGNASDIPLAGDFDGDGKDTLSIYRPSGQRFYIINELGKNEGGLGEAEYSFVFGNPGDKPVVGDWDGDGIDEVGLHRESTGFFYWRNTLTTGPADGEFFFGDPDDRFVAGDWGVVDGTDTPGLFRPSDVTFYFRNTLTQGVADSQFTWTGASAGWLPVAGNVGPG